MNKSFRFRHLSLLSLLPVIALSCFAPRAQAAETTAPATGKPARPGVALFAGKRTLILGDSITQNGTYVSFIEYFLQKQNPDTAFDIISAGLASETVSGLSEKGHAGGAFPRPCLHERLGRALSAVKPTLVVACYGMNDGIYQPYDASRADAFRTGMKKLADASRKAGAPLVLVTPPAFDASNVGGWGAFAGYDEVLAKFAAWEVANPPAGVVATADLHRSMAADLAARRKADPKFHFTTDGIHPGELGHLVMAVTILKELGIVTPAVAPESLLKQIQADPLWPLINKRRNLRSNAWLAEIGYDREKHVAPGSGKIAEAEKTAAALQTQIDALRRKPAGA